jgi:hypothetical protein
MHGATKALLKTASVIALLSGSLLLPSSASAQFNFPGIGFRVPYMGSGGHYRGRHYRTHETRHHKRSHEEPDDTDSAEHSAQSNGKSAPQPLSAPVKDTPPPQQAVSAAPPKPAGEEPTFSPSR